MGVGEGNVCVVIFAFWGYNPRVSSWPNVEKQEPAFGGRCFTLDSRFRGNDKTRVTLG